eukprot:GHRR01000748.1.p1 GENE.GHRR01000748.1~~GHRR01000748.1.p1  ORF type:complete len:385 (+),score=106.17 GHRR01000748.1:472-1626(+)
MTTVEAPAGIDEPSFNQQDSLKESAFETAQPTAEDDAFPAKASAHAELSAPLVSGPMLTSLSVTELDQVPDIPFDELCNSGAQVTSRNWLNKLYRYTLLPTKEIYLPFMTWGMPTNYLMLTFRTYNRDFDLPNHNDDDLAQRLRDTLMPERGRLHRDKSWVLKFKTGLLNTPYLGIPGIVNFIDVRTQWFDAAVKRAIADGIKQIVIIAAGYDTRAYRLGQPGVKFYEIDLPNDSEKKKELVKQHMPADKYTWPEFVGADLSKVSLIEALSNTSFDTTKRTLFTMEGLIYYLPPAAVKQQLTSISETAVAGSRLFFDYLHLQTVAGDVFNPGFETMMVVGYRPIAALNCMLSWFERDHGLQLTGLHPGLLVGVPTVPSVSIGVR